MYEMPATSLLYPTLWYHGRDKDFQPTKDRYGFSSSGRRLKPCKVKVQGVKFGDTPVKLTCPSCTKEVTTVALEEDGDCSLSLLSLAMVLLCFIPCIFLSRCKDTVHYCPECRREIGRFTRNRFRPYKPVESYNAADTTFTPEIMCTDKIKDDEYTEKSKDV